MVIRGNRMYKQIIIEWRTERMKRLVSKLWILVVSILFFCLFQTNLLSETPDNIFDVFSKINPKQPISIGEEI